MDAPLRPSRPLRSPSLEQTLVLDCSGSIENDRLIDVAAEPIPRGPAHHGPGCQTTSGESIDIASNAAEPVRSIRRSDISQNEARYRQC